MKKLLNLLGGVVVAAAIAIAVLAPTPLFAQSSTLGGPIRLGAGTASQSGASYASTLANKAGVVTTESVTTSPNTETTFTITNTTVAATDLCMASVATTGTGSPVVTKVTPAAGSLAVVVRNVNQSASFNAALAITFICFKP